MTERKGHWMQTASGRKFWPLDPRPEEVFIEDIGHALGMLCRYGGHCYRFYSVAEHSILASYLVPEEHALVALMHDAAEAYCVDVPRPIKKYLANYAEIEARIWKAIAIKYRLPIELPQCVHDADVAMVFAEKDQIMLPAHEGFSMGLTTPIKQRPRVLGLDPRSASNLFLERFDDLFYRRKVA